MPAAIVADRCADALGHLVQAPDEILNRHALERALTLQRGVQVGNVGLVVLVMVQMHGLLVNVRLKRGVVVRQRWKLERHWTLLHTMRTTNGPAETASAGPLPALGTSGWARLRWRSGRLCPRHGRPDNERATPGRCRSACLCGARPSSRQPAETASPTNGGGVKVTSGHARSLVRLDAGRPLPSITASAIL